MHNYHDTFNVFPQPRFAAMQILLENGPQAC
ncbi:MAG: hypothetical protein R3C12_09360 [Planctomycetaceae bacterium]